MGGDKKNGYADVVFISPEFLPCDHGSPVRRNRMSRTCVFYSENVVVSLGSMRLPKKPVPVGSWAVVSQGRWVTELASFVPAARPGRRLGSAAHLMHGSLLIPGTSTVESDVNPSVSGKRRLAGW